MTTAIWRRGGDMILNAQGAPLAGGQLFYYQAGTTNIAATYSNNAGTILNPQPIVLNASGRLPNAVYFGSAYSYKELLTDANGATISPWPFDNLPAAVGAPQQQTGFERLYLPWVLLTSASSPVTLTQAAAGDGYECDCTSGSIAITLPAASAANLAGTGYFFKRIDSVIANNLTIAPNGSDTIDGVNAAISVSVGYDGVYLVSDGAQWLTYSFFNQSARMVVSRQAVTANSTSLAINMNLGWYVSLSLRSNVSSAFTISNWPAAGSLGKLTLDITSTGAYNISQWPGTTLWPGNGAPTITPSGRDIIMLTSTDGGNTFLGYTVAQNMLS